LVGIATPTEPPAEAVAAALVAAAAAALVAAAAGAALVAAAAGAAELAAAGADAASPQPASMPTAMAPQRIVLSNCFFILFSSLCIAVNCFAEQCPAS
jgi:hypothetical protein